MFIFGMGYTSQALANALKQQGWDVAGTCRSEEKRAALKMQGFRAHLFNPSEEEYLQEEAIRKLHEASHIVSSIPPLGDSGCDPVLASHRKELLKEPVPWMGYLSSTSVYGDWQGEWVDEETEPRPLEKRAVTRWEAEKQWMQLGEESGGYVRVFRLGGIYGPGRSALDTLRKGETLSSRQRLREQKRFTSRVHVADICQVIVKAMASENPGTGSFRVYNVVDDDPSPRAKVMSYARRLLQGTSVDDDDLSDTNLSTSNGQASEKRVSNSRVKAELQVEFLYPSFRSGLEAIAIASNR